MKTTSVSFSLKTHKTRLRKPKRRQARAKRVTTLTLLMIKQRSKRKLSLLQLQMIRLQSFKTECKKRGKTYAWCALMRRSMNLKLQLVKMCKTKLQELRAIAGIVACSKSHGQHL